MKNFMISSLLLILAFFKGSCQQYYKQEWIEGNPASFCTHSRTLLSYFTTNPNKYEIDLNRKYSSVIFTLKWNATQAKKIKSECKFSISTKDFDKKGGIYLNILDMKLRQYRNSERCIDSLQIKYNGNIKQNICGNLAAGKIKSYEDLTGKVKLTLNIDTSVPFEHYNDFIELQFVATAFRECRDFDKEYDCQPNNARSCIDKHFVNDTIVNCVEPHCSDEHSLGCASSSVYVSLDSLDESGANENIIQIFLSAITSLILTMLTCGALMWIVYKIKRCISPPPAASTTATRVHRRRRRHNTEVVSTSQDNSSPSAPPVDKDDLPPSYSDLFPEQGVSRKNDTENT